MKNESGLLYKDNKQGIKMIMDLQNHEESETSEEVEIKDKVDLQANHDGLEFAED